MGNPRMLTRRMGVRSILLSAFVLASMSCGGAEQVAKNDIVLSDWETVMHVKFPPGTEALGLMKLEERDSLVRLKVKMPAAAWPEFLGNAPIDEQDLTDKRRFFLGPDEEWWDPSKPASLPTAQARLANGSVVNIGVDQSGGETVIVYLLWHET